MDLPAGHPCSVVEADFAVDPRLFGHFGWETWRRRPVAEGAPPDRFVEPQRPPQRPRNAVLVRARFEPADAAGRGRGGERPGQEGAPGQFAHPLLVVPRRRGCLTLRHAKPPPAPARSPLPWRESCSSPPGLLG